MGRLPISVSGQDDRRVRKTTAALREALHSLIVEKPYDEIAVKEILDRADVGRSTFYTHFRDKDDLLASSIEGILDAARAASYPRSGPWYERIVWFSRPILDYHERQRAAHRMTLPRSAKSVLHRHLHAALVDLITDAMSAEPRAAKVGRSQIPRELVVTTLASTFVLVFGWWLEQKRPLPAAEANALFKALVVPSLAAM